LARPVTKLHLTAAFKEITHMTGNADIERRTLLGAITAASGAVVSSTILLGHVAAQPGSKSTSAVSDDFETAEVKTGDKGPDAPQRLGDSGYSPNFKNRSISPSNP
jgi:hypothetical protein